MKRFWQTIVVTFKRYWKIIVQSIVNFIANWRALNTLIRWLKG